MSESEYTPPTDQQLANFLVIDAKNDPRTALLDLQPDILLHLLETNPLFKAAGLKRHAQFIAMIDEHTDKMKRGQLRCEYIRPNGKRCVNWNVPGSFYCGIESHQAEGEL